MILCNIGKKVKYNGRKDMDIMCLSVRIKLAASIYECFGMEEKNEEITSDH